jgi:hypothetical protein
MFTTPRELTELKHAIAKGKSKDARRITVETTREFVKNLYGIGGVSVQGN